MQVASLGHDDARVESIEKIVSDRILYTASLAIRARRQIQKARELTASALSHDLDRDGGRVVIHHLHLDSVINTDRP